MNLIYHGLALIVLICALIALYAYRRWLENHDDPYIHLHNDVHDADIINTQTVMNKRLDAVDKVKKIGLWAVILYGLVVIGIAIYQGWMLSTTQQ